MAHRAAHLVAILVAIRSLPRPMISVARGTAAIRFASGIVAQPGCAARARIKASAAASALSTGPEAWTVPSIGETMSSIRVMAVPSACSPPVSGSCLRRGRAARAAEALPVPDAPAREDFPSPGSRPCRDPGPAAQARSKPRAISRSVTALSKGLLLDLGRAGVMVDQPVAHRPAQHRRAPEGPGRGVGRRQRRGGTGRM